MSLEIAEDGCEVHGINVSEEAIKLREASCIKRGHSMKKDVI